VVPKGADTNIRENVSREGDVVTLTGDAPIKAGQNVRYAGGDFVEARSSCQRALNHAAWALAAWRGMAN
jgi:molybdopterin biosynthesis enzyme